MIVRAPRRYWFKADPRLRLYDHRTGHGFTHRHESVIGPTDRDTISMIHVATLGLGGIARMRDQDAVEELIYLMLMNNKEECTNGRK